MMRYSAGPAATFERWFRLSRSPATRYRRALRRRRYRHCGTRRGKYARHAPPIERFR